MKNHYKCKVSETITKINFETFPFEDTDIKMDSDNIDNNKHINNNTINAVSNLNIMTIEQVAYLFEKGDIKEGDYIHLVGIANWINYWDYSSSPQSYKPKLSKTAFKMGILSAADKTSEAEILLWDAPFKKDWNLCYASDVEDAQQASFLLILNVQLKSRQSKPYFEGGEHTYFVPHFHSEVALQICENLNFLETKDFPPIKCMFCF